MFPFPAPLRAAALACAFACVASRAAASIPVLVFEKRLPASVEPYGAVDSLLQRLAPALGLELRFTRDSTLFQADSLRRYRIIVWNNVMRNVLSESQQRAFEAYMQAGGGYVGFHAAATNRRLWPWYVDSLLGGDNYAQDHIAWGTTTIYADTAARPGRALGSNHPIMAGAPKRVSHYGEYYWWNPDPADNPAITVLQWYQPKRVDSTWPAALPITWCREYGTGPKKGRLFYTQASHESALYREEWYAAMVTNALRWTAGDGATALHPGNPQPVRGIAARMRVDGRRTRMLPKP